MQKNVSDGFTANLSGKNSGFFSELSTFQQYSEQRSQCISLESNQPLKIKIAMLLFRFCFPCYQSNVFSTWRSMNLITKPF